MVIIRVQAKLNEGKELYKLKEARARMLPSPGTCLFSTEKTYSCPVGFGERQGALPRGFTPAPIPRLKYDPNTHLIFIY
jgi:hypothetical protein